LKFNLSKTLELVIPARRSLSEPPHNPGIQRASSIKILGVILDSNLTFTNNAESSINACNQSLYALRVMKQHGLADTLVQLVFKTTVVPKLLYASPSWHGFVSKSTIDRYEAFIRKAKRLGYYKTNEGAESLLNIADLKLFTQVLQNTGHILHNLLPAKRYFLRGSWHGRDLGEKDDRNFTSRMLYSNIY